MPIYILRYFINGNGVVNEGHYVVFPTDDVIRLVSILKPVVNSTLLSFFSRSKKQQNKCCGKGNGKAKNIFLNERRRQYALSGDSDNIPPYKWINRVRDQSRPN